MQSISNAEISDMLLFVEGRMNLTLERCRSILSVLLHIIIQIKKELDNN